MASKLQQVLDTTVAVAEQFSSSLSSSNTAESSSINSETQPSPLPLLSASAQSLRAQTTKLSLLAINTPFTPSAIISVVSNINYSVLPSLVTAALLLVPEKYTKTFSAESKALVKDALSELTALITDVKAIAENYNKNSKLRLSNESKQVITTATGRVWKVCDQINGLVADGVVGLVIKKAKEYLALVQDGIREMKEWDPADSPDPDDALWDGFGDDDEDNPASIQQGEDTPDEDEDEEDDGNQRAKLEAEQKYLLRLFMLVSQLYTAIMSHRLKTLDESAVPKYAQSLDSISLCLRTIPDLVDEAAGSLYEHNIEFADANGLKLQDEARQAIDDMLYEPWTNRPSPGNSGAVASSANADDVFWQWANPWLKALDKLENDRKQ